MSGNALNAVLDIPAAPAPVEVMAVAVDAALAAELNADAALEVMAAPAAIPPTAPTATPITSAAYTKRSSQFCLFLQRGCIPP